MILQYIAGGLLSLCNIYWALPQCTMADSEKLILHIIENSSEFLMNFYAALCAAPLRMKADPSVRCTFTITGSILAARKVFRSRQV